MYLSTGVWCYAPLQVFEQVLKAFVDVVVVVVVHFSQGSEGLNFL
jgi:hypothetical protein